jgi:LysM repeat protein
MHTLTVRMPFDSDAIITTSSSHGHHRPYGGDVSCDMDVLIASRGVPVAFDVASTGSDVRAIVESIRPACASGRIEDGGHAVRLNLQRRDGTGGWLETGLRLLYAHLDPVAVSAGDIVGPGRTHIGALGPAVAQDWPTGRCGRTHPAGDAQRGEYHSGCAVHSHVHIEAFGANSVPARGARLAPGDAVIVFPLAGDDSPSAPVIDAPVEVPAAPASTYVVQPGDHLIEIAARLGVSLPALLEANPDLLTPGQELVVPGLIYTVRPRDTLGEIAQRFGVSVRDLADANGIQNVNVIHVGQFLTIPRSQHA